MNYYYDIILNFDMDSIWEFYEWEKTDPFVYVKKIPLFRVDYDTMLDFLTYHIQVKQEFLKEIQGKVSVRNPEEEMEYAFLMSDTKNSLAVMLNEEGKVIALSKVLIQDDNNINEFMYTLKESSIPYATLKEREKRNGLRQENAMKQMITLELSTLMKEKNVQKLKYLYYEWFGEEEEDLGKMYQMMKDALQNSGFSTLEKISYFIRLSYHQV